MAALSTRVGLAISEGSVCLQVYGQIPERLVHIGEQLQGVDPLCCTDADPLLLSRMPLLHLGAGSNVAGTAAH